MIDRVQVGDYQIGSQVPEYVIHQLGGNYSWTDETDFLSFLIPIFYLIS
jgi:hypothetical protein